MDSAASPLFDAMLEKEWRSVVGFEGVYEVTAEGRVRRIKSAQGATVGAELHPRIDAHGYPVVRLTVGCKSRGHLVHRLVAFAFLGPPPSDRHEVNHKDRNRSNPHVSNLEWVTRSENNLHAYANGAVALRGEQKPHKLTESDVREILASSETHRALGARYGVHHRTIGDIKRGRKWRHVPRELPCSS